MKPGNVRAGNLYGQVSLPYLMDDDVSVDVDLPSDLALAEFLLLRSGRDHA